VKTKLIYVILKRGADNNMFVFSPRYILV